VEPLPAPAGDARGDHNPNHRGSVARHNDGLAAVMEAAEGVGGARGGPGSVGTQGHIRESLEVLVTAVKRAAGGQGTFKGQGRASLVSR
jgi:hypothetical protein